MKNLLNSIGLLLLVLISFNCKKDNLQDPIIYDNGNDKPSIEVGNIVTHSVSGRVVDDNDIPISGALVTLLDEQTTTNSDGIFELLNVPSHEKHMHVKVMKPGFFPGSRSLVPTDGINSVRVKLRKLSKIGSFDANSGGNLSLENVKIEIGGGIVDANNKEYTGKVEVYATYIDPTHDDLVDVMPGDLRGATDNGEVQMISYGMVSVELKDVSGNELQLAKENKATLIMNIPSEIRSSAPSTIPLWHFDENKGHWIEEGSATKVGNEYIGDVNHFSTWNVDDIAGPVIRTSGRVITENGIPLPGVIIRLNNNNSMNGNAVTDSKGKFSLTTSPRLSFLVTVAGKFPLFFEFEKNIGVLNDGDTIGDIIIPLSALKDLVMVNGSVEDCDGKNAKDAIVKYNKYQYVHGINGNFAFFVTKNTNFTLQAFQKVGGAFGDPLNVTMGNTNKTLQPITYCTHGVDGTWYTDNGDFITMWVKWNVDGKPFNTQGIHAMVNTNTEELHFLLGGALEHYSNKYDSVAFRMFKGYKGPGKYKFTPSTDWYIGLSLDTIGSAPLTIVDYEYNVDVQEIDLAPYGKCHITFSGTVTTEDKNKNRKTHQITGGDIVCTRVGI